MRTCTCKRYLAVSLSCLLPVVFMGSSQAASWKTDWARTVAAANKEGRLIVSGPSGVIWRQQLMTFEKAYPHIHLSISPSSSTNFWPRLIKERDAGQYLWDLRVGGPDEESYSLMSRGYFAPVRNLLVLPDVNDPKVWYGGFNGLFMDNAKRYFPGFAMYEETAGYYDNKYTPHPLTVEDLIKPRWKGRITMPNPVGGSANNTLAALYRQFGEQFVRKFLAQNLVITHEWRQQMDWMAAGRYPISIGVPSIAFVEYAKRGMPLGEYKRLRGLKAWAQGVGGVQLLTHGPDPAAAKVFINWLLTRQEQNRLMKAVHLNSRRKDVPVYDHAEAVDVHHLNEYIGSPTQAQVVYHRKVQKLLSGLGY